MKRRRLSVLVLVLVLVVAGACSGDDEPTSTEVAVVTDGPGPEAPPEVSSPTTTTTVDVSTTIDAGGDTTTTLDDVAGGATTTTSTASAPSAAPSSSATSPSYAPSPQPDGDFVRIGDDYFTFEPDNCLIYEGIDAVVSGPGEAPDGTPIYVSLEITTLRIDLGTDEPYTMQAEHWAAGDGAGDDMVVSTDNWTVTAEGTFVYGPTQRHLRGELRADCDI